MCADNVFFLGVACQVVKEELAKDGFAAEFHRCEVDSGDDRTWQDMQFKYFQSDSYFIPIVQWAEDAAPVVREAQLDEEAAGKEEAAAQ